MIGEEIELLFFDPTTVERCHHLSPPKPLKLVALKGTVCAQGTPPFVIRKSFWKNNLWHEERPLLLFLVSISG